MSAVGLAWRSLTPSNSPKFMVKGCELNVALAGVNSRFAIVEVRCYDADGNSDRRYAVRDAHTVSDADVKGGKRPAVVSNCETLDGALAFIAEAS